MSMKKVVILAAAALTLAACAKTYELQETAQPKIGFDTWANNLTKARTAGSNEFVDGDDFAVYGYKYKSSGDNNTVTVFDDVVVTKNSTWGYDVPRFWDSNYEKYTFYAVSPASVGTSGTVDPQTGEITSTNITFAGNDNDILVADMKVVNKNDGNANFNGYSTVEMHFNHVTSLVDIKVKKTPALQDVAVTVSALALNNIENKGVLTVNDAYTNNKPVADWSNAGTGSYSASLASAATIVEDPAFNATTPATPTGSTSIIEGLIVKPQTFETSGDARQQISITYKIGAEDAVTKELYLSDFDTVDDAAQDDNTKVAKWEPGKHYTFYITIDAKMINFSADITPWAAVTSGYNYILK